MVLHEESNSHQSYYHSSWEGPGCLNQISGQSIEWLYFSLDSAHELCLLNLKIQAVSLSNRRNNLFRMWLITFLWRTCEVTPAVPQSDHSKESTKILVNQKLNGMYTVLSVIWSNTDIHWKYFVIIQMFWIHTHPCPHPLSSLPMVASLLISSNPGVDPWTA